jgi:hypothetical protein
MAITNRRLYADPAQCRGFLGRRPRRTASEEGHGDEAAVGGLKIVCAKPPRRGRYGD